MVVYMDMDNGQLSIHGQFIVHVWITVHGPLWTTVHAWISIKLSIHGLVHVHKGGGGGPRKRWTISIISYLKAPLKPTSSQTELAEHLVVRRNISKALVYSLKIANRMFATYGILEKSKGVTFREGTDSLPNSSTPTPS